MGNPLRERRSAAEWAASRQVVEISEKIGNFEQLSAILEADLATLDAARMPAEWRGRAVSGRLEFGFADARRVLPVVVCRAGAVVDAVCQRCLEPFRLPLDVEGKLLLLEFEQTADGYDEYEVWELEDALLRPQDIVEEMLIMALPFSAMHTESAACRALAETSGSADMTTPFADLRERMAKDN